MNFVIKRSFDIIFSLCILIVLFPIFLIIGICIKIDSTGPILFLQDRIGLDGKEFKIVKFRTMVQNAETIGDGISIKSDSDSRITKTGKFLRKTSLDEFPQFYNVLIGNMAMIGPRPPVPFHPYKGFDGYPDDYKKRFNMRPGITGLAQVKVRNSATWDERIQIDIKYVENFNLLLDTRIFFETIKQILFRKNIY